MKSCRQPWAKFQVRVCGDTAVIRDARNPERLWAIFLAVELDTIELPCSLRG